MRSRQRRRALLVIPLVLGGVAALAFLVAVFATDQRLSPTRVEIHLAGVPVLSIPYADIERVEAGSRLSLAFRSNPFRTLRVGGCLRDDAVRIRRRQGWITTVIVCPRDRQGFVQQVEKRRPTSSACGRGEVASWSPDSAIAVCLPPGFHPVVGEYGHFRWERGDIRSRDRAWLSIAVDSSNDSDDPWPPALAGPSGCLADCGSADSVTRYRDTVATGVAVVEVGLVSGGFAGLRRQPMMVAGWELPRGRRVWVNGYAAESPTLDTLRRAVRSVQLVTF